MLYQAYQAHSDFMVPVRTLATLAASAMGPQFTGDVGVIRNLTAAYELIARAGLTHDRPPFDIERIEHRGCGAAALLDFRRMLVRLGFKLQPTLL